MGGLKLLTLAWPLHSAQDDGQEGERGSREEKEDRRTRGWGDVSIYPYPSHPHDERVVVPQYSVGFTHCG